MKSRVPQPPCHKRFVDLRPDEADIVILSKKGGAFTAGLHTTR